MTLVVLKLGGSVITRKSENKQEVNPKNLSRLAGEVSQALKKNKKLKLVVVHGAGPFGHVLAKKYRLHEGLKSRKQVKGMALTHQSMEKLNIQVVEALQSKGVDAVTIQPSAVGVLWNSKLSHFPTGVIEALLVLGIVPVLYGDVLLDEETGVNILSGDHLVPYMARKLKADRVIVATDTPGIFDKDPKKNKDAKLIKRLDKNKLKKIKLTGSRAVDVTGGMERKVRELMELTKHKTKVKIVSALKPGLVKDAVLGKQVEGTTISK